MRTFHMLRRGSTLTAYQLVVVLRLGLVHRAHAAGAQGVHQGERPEDEALGLALQQPLGLELGQDALADQELGQGRRLRAGVLAEELADDLVELAAVDEVAAAQVPDEPFAGPKVGRQHVSSILCSRRECSLAWQRPRKPSLHSRSANLHFTAIWNYDLGSR